MEKVDVYKERRVKLVAALRSGKYLQGQFRLRSRITTKISTFCCLGVACDVSKLGKWDGTLYFDHDRSLPYIVQEYYGFKNQYGAATYDSLAKLNDVSYYTFEQIANVIENDTSLWVEGTY